MRLPRIIAGGGANNKEEYSIIVAIAVSIETKPVCKILINPYKYGLCQNRFIIIVMAFVFLMLGGN